MNTEETRIFNEAIANLQGMLDTGLVTYDEILEALDLELENE